MSSKRGWWSCAATVTSTDGKELTLRPTKQRGFGVTSTGLGWSF